MNPQIILFVAILIQNIGFFIVIQILTGRLLKWKEGLITLACAIAVIPLFPMITYWLNLVTIGIFTIALLYKKQSVFFAVTIPSITFIISIMCDYILNPLLWSAFNIQVGDISSDLRYTILYAIAMMLFACLIAFVLKKVIDKWSVYTYLNQRKYGFMILAVVLLTLLIYHLNIFFSAADGFIQEIVRLNTVIFLVYFLTLIGILYMVLQSAIQEIKMKTQQEQFEQLQEYTTTLESLHKEMRIFRHDYINILSSMAGYMEKDDIEGLKKFFSENIVPINQTMISNNHKISLLQNIHVMELKGLIAIKLIRAQELKIDAIVEVVEEIDKINMPSIDLCKIVGILLDNAVEAAAESKDPFIRLAVVKREDSVLIVFANSIPENMPPVYKIFEEGFSTKGDARGLGLASLRETIQKYSNVTLATKLMDREFIQELEII
nr:MULTISPECIES: GHKL domain-containing protein [Listeria]